MLLLVGTRTKSRSGEESDLISARELELTGVLFKWDDRCDVSRPRERWYVLIIRVLGRAVVCGILIALIVEVPLLVLVAVDVS